jgi:tRNA1(Val) A37 N6-methylase TrmN6
MNSFEKYIIEQSPEDFNYGQLLVANDSRYSCLMPWHIDQVAGIFLYETQNLCINDIIDSTGNIGCDSILFRLLYPDANITTIELNKNTYDLLVTNMNNLKNITHQNVKEIKTLNMNCLNYIYENIADMIYVDPPWDGESYKNQKYHNLSLTDSSFNMVEIGKIVNKLLISNDGLIVVKLPYNINFNKFKNQVMYKFTRPIYMNNYTIYTSSGKISYVLSFIKFY